MEQAELTKRISDHNADIIGKLNAKLRGPTHLRACLGCGRKDVHLSASFGMCGKCLHEGSKAVKEAQRDGKASA